MATVAASYNEPAKGERFFSKMAIIMALTVVLGFSVQFLAGRSTFASPLRVHAHAVLFMGWVGIFVLQSWLATRGPIALHRTLGWLALLWITAMMAAAMVVIVAMTRNGTVPFFFQPQHFLFADPLTLICFIALTGFAIQKRRETDWHARLHICAMTLLTGPAFGRLLPMPLLIPYAFEAAGLATTVFLFAGIIRDYRVTRAIHPAWWFGFAGLAVNLVGAQLLANSAIGNAVYEAVVAGYPGEHVAGLDFPPPPDSTLRTGRGPAT